MGAQFSRLPRPVLRKLDTSAPQLCIFGPDGTVIRHVQMEGAPLLTRHLRSALRKNPDLNRPSQQEHETLEALSREDTPAHRLRLARMALEASEWQAASAHLEAAGESGISELEIERRTLKARCLRCEKKFEEAQEILSGIDLDGNLPAAVEAVWLAIDRKEFDTADELADRALERAKDGEERGALLYQKGLIPYLQRKDKSAVRLWTAAVRERPDDPWMLRASWKMFVLGVVANTHVTESLRGIR